MRPIDFPEANVFFNKPESMMDEECYPVSAFKGENNGNPFINVVWQPNKEDIESIVAGRPIVCSFATSFLVPHSLFTFDENSNPND